MKSWKLAVLVAALVTGLCALAAAQEMRGHAGLLVPTRLGPDAPKLLLWEPGESWVGGSQYDERLDQPVEFWHAGLRLSDVFAGIQYQTGVRLDFWPPGDQNERIRVNLYLNPDRPLSLREVMVQLTWVTQCVFACAHRDDATEELDYYLLRTSIGQGVVQKLNAETRAFEEQQAQSEAETRQKVAAKLKEYRAALGLSRKEVISRYRGVDDMLVLNMLDPAHRAATRYVLSLPPDNIAALLQGDRVSRRLKDLTPEQRRDVTQALSRFPKLRERNQKELQDKFQSGTLGVWVDGATHGYIRVFTALGDGAEWAQPSRRTAIVDGTSISVQETIALRRQLGDKMTAELEETIYEQHKAARRQQRNRELLETLLSEPALSPDASAILSSLMIPWDGESQYPLWQVQEAIASASGLHIISDCFWQPPRSPGRYLYLLDPSYAAGRSAGGRQKHRELLPAPSVLSALNCLITLCHPKEVRTDFLRPVSAAYLRDCTGSEWEDAGPFLRFRSLNRDVWRASMLPSHVVELIDAKLTPHVQAELLLDEHRPHPVVAINPEEQASIVRQLSDLQILFGGKLAYEDPSQHLGRLKQQMRCRILNGMASNLAILRFLATLGDSQWHRLRGPGLRVPGDLTPDQRAMPGLRLKMEAMGAARAWTSGEIVLKCLPAAFEPCPPEGVTALEMRSRDQRIGEWYFAFWLQTQLPEPPPLSISPEVSGQAQSGRDRRRQALP